MLTGDHHHKEGEATDEVVELDPRAGSYNYTDGSASSGGGGKGSSSWGVLGGLRYSPKKRKYLATLVAVLAVTIFIVALMIIIIALANTSDQTQLSDDVEIEPLMETLKSLQSIADDNNNIRFTGTPGYDASVNFAISELSKNDDLLVFTQTFYVSWFSVVGTPLLAQTSPSTYSYEYLVDFSVLSESPDGAGTGTIANVANNGCDDSDYTAVSAGSIALVSTGVCSRTIKASSAARAGAIAVIIYNAEGTTAPVSGWVTSTIPAFGLSFIQGYLLSQSLQPPTLNFEVVGTHINTTSQNVLAETKMGNNQTVIVVGGHLDSDDVGPGINDNGSGSAAVLELAAKIGEIKKDIKNKIVFALWGAEELGLLGSSYYVQHQSEYHYTIGANINLDMLGSANYIYAFHNGSSAPTVELQAPCTKLQKLFETFMNSSKLPYEYFPFAGNSDYDPFLKANIPANGITGGYNQIKTSAERATFGGLADVAFDPCLHQACDTITNVNQDVLLHETQAVAYVLQQLTKQNDLHKFLYES
ncbi:M28 family peptidase [Pelomyxa schiedti]|nr:M28 family peptidase [Pelomyxa schiedti]